MTDFEFALHGDLKEIDTDINQLQKNVSHNLGGEADEAYEIGSSGSEHKRLAHVSGTVRYGTIHSDVEIYLNGDRVATTSAPSTGTISVTQGDILEATRPTSFVYNSDGIALVPLSWAGTEFIYYMNRYSPDTVYIYSPNSVAEVEYYSDAYPEDTTPFSTVTVEPGELVELTTESDALGYQRFISSAPVVISKNGGGNTNDDSFVVPPASREVLHTFAENKSTVHKGNSISSSNPYYHSDGRFSTTQIADGSGTQAEMGKPYNMCGDTYILPHTISDYEVGAIEACKIRIDYWDGSAWVNYDTIDLTNASRENPLKASEGDESGSGTDLITNAPIVFSADRPFYIRTNNGSQEYSPIGLKASEISYEANPFATTGELEDHTSSSNPHSGSASESWVDSNYSNYTFSESYIDLSNRSHGNEDHDVSYLAQSDYNPETDTHDKYTDSEAITAVNGETSLDVDVSGSASTTQNNLDSHESASNPHTASAAETWVSNNFNNYTFSESHNDLSNVGSSDHHTRYSDSEAVSAVNSESSLSVDISGDADTVDGYHGDDLTRPKNAASFTSTDTTTDINTTAWTQIPWDVQKDVDAGYTHDPANTPAEITFDEAGTYQVYVSLSYDTDNLRVNPGIKFAINGTRRNAMGLSGYIRHGSGHSEGSNSLMETITVSAGDTLTVQTFEYGNSGTVTMRSKESVLTVEQISETVAIAGDTDTVDGYHAADFVLAGGDTMTGPLTLSDGSTAASQSWTNSNFNNYSFSESHNDLTNVGSSDHHAKYTDSEARSAVTNSTLDGNVQLQWLQVGQTPSGGSRGGIQAVESNWDYDGFAIETKDESGSYLSRLDITTGASPSGSNTATMTFKNIEEYNFENGGIYEQGNKVATRTWTNSNFNNYSDSQARSAVEAGNLAQIDGANGHRIRFDSSSSWMEFTDQSNNRADIVTNDTYADGTWFSDHQTNNSAHHAKYTDSEARSAIESANLSNVGFGNIEDVNDGEIGRDNSIGFLGSWGSNGTAVLWDSYNVNAGNAISISGGKGNESNPTIAVNESGISHDNIGGVSSGDHHTRYADSEAVSAVNAETSLSVDIGGDAETVDGFHAADLGSDVSDDGTTVVSNATDVNFRDNLSVTDDTDGTVTVDASGGASAFGGSHSATGDGSTAKFTWTIDNADDVNWVSIAPKTTAASVDYTVVIDDSVNGVIGVEYATPPADGDVLEWFWTTNSSITSVGYTDDDAINAVQQEARQLPSYSSESDANNAGLGEGTLAWVNGNLMVEDGT